jgi:hypothetical protein
MAEDKDRGVFVELLMGAARDLVHGHVRAAFDARGGVLPGLTHVEEEGWLLGGEMGAKLVNGDFEVHAESLLCGVGRGWKQAHYGNESTARATVTT